MVIDNQTTHDAGLVEVYGNLDLPEGTLERPLVTFVLFAYNQEKYIREAVEGALAQSYSPLEIILSDDCSCDRSFDIMRDIVKSYTGEHLLILRRNPVNMGLIEHINGIFSIARSDYIVAAAGDDISLPGRVEKLMPFLKEGALLVHSDYECIGEDGSAVEFGRPDIKSFSSDLRKIARSGCRYLGATGAWNKKIIEKGGPIKQRAAWEDTVLGFRAAVLNSHSVSYEVLVKYRISSGVTSNLRSSRMSVSKLRALIATFRQVYDDATILNVEPEILDEILDTILINEIKLNFAENKMFFLKKISVKSIIVMMRRLLRKALA